MLLRSGKWYNSYKILAREYFFLLFQRLYHFSLKQKNLHELNEFQILDFDYYLHHHYYYYYILYILLYLLIYITLQIDFAIFSFYVSIV